MVFCRFEVEFENVRENRENDNVEETGRRRGSLTSRSAIWRDIEKYNEKFDGKAYIFTAQSSLDTLVGAAVAESVDEVRNSIADYLGALQMKLKDIYSIEEVTFDSFIDLCDYAETAGNLRRGRRFLSDMGISNVYMEIRRSMFEYGEKLADRKSKEKLRAIIEKTLYSDTMLPELERIFACAGRTHRRGHPCHYFIESAEGGGSRDDACNALLSALYSAGRLSSCRYWYIDVDPSDRVTRGGLEHIFANAKGATVVIRFTPSNDSEEGEYASANRNMVELFCRVIKKYQNDTLTVVCIPANSLRVKTMFYEELGSINVVECREDRASGERAKRYLRILCKENDVLPDKNLYSKLEDGVEYLTEELNLTFNEWYNRKLKTTIYPEYRNLERAEFIALEHKSRGTAMARLNELIGLSEAKAVIKRATDYFAAQKLFKDRGFKADRPNLSMVFTGNPGSCKTTVARLVSEIFRDCGILSAGRMVECGRADLVAKYVGWTAQTIKNKFAEARGSVLFIDEAYSLVDDRDGSFGDEAINTIVQEMENHRDDVLVIFAGYPDKMERFLNKNPGLRSRISFHVRFEDYNADELCGIASLMAKNKGLTVSDEAMEKMHTVFERISAKRDFGNGRAARNVIESAKMAMASRIIHGDIDKLTEKDITTILPEDVVEPEIKPAEILRAVGF